MKHIILIIFVIAIAISCKEESKIDPLVKAKTLSERFGSQEAGTRMVTIPIKILLTENELPRYDLQDILDGGLDDVEVTETDGENGTTTVDPSNIPVEQRSFLKRIKYAFKHKLYNLGLRVGIENTYKASFAQELPDLDPKYLKSLKLKRLFVAIEPCDADDIECQVRQVNKAPTLFFLEKFFLNISVMQTSEELRLLYEDETSISAVSQEDFDKAVDKAWGKQPVDFNNYVNSETGLIDENVFYDLNVAQLDNAKNRKELNSLTNRRNIRDNGKNFIARINKNNILQAREFFRHEDFKKSVKDLTFLKKSLYIELHSPEHRKLFFKTIKEQDTDMREAGVFEIEGCTLLTCTNVKVNQINLVPMLNKSNKVRFDTYISVNELDSNDFSYSGYIELEVKLELPL